MAHCGVGRRYLGVEISTQQLKVVVIDDGLNVLHESGIKFDEDLPEFKTDGGVHVHKDQLTVTAPTLMWVKALDMAMDHMMVSGFDFSMITALSGTGQECFSIADSPIWQDSSTTAQCRHLEEVMGGAQKVSEVTGSRAYERFTGNQIAKIYQKCPDAYNDTECISLVSSFCACLFLGDYAPIDYSDGSGMNLLDIRTLKWSPDCLNACAPGLASRLGEPVASYASVGTVSSYMVDKYGFSPECQVIAFTGDNPASVAGMCLRRGDVIISLGTSDTLSLWINEPRPALTGHVFVNPVDVNAYMALLCYKNGSLTRQRIQLSQAGGDWETFNHLLSTTPPGNDGNIGIYFDIQEITPHAVGIHRMNATGQTVKTFQPATEVRAVVEGQMMAKRIHAEGLGYALSQESRILATGGASSNKAILQIIADVFGTAVYTQDVLNSACLGSAYRAKHGYLGGERTPFADVVKAAPEFVCVAQPQAEATKVYIELCQRYKEFEDGLKGHAA